MLMSMTSIFDESFGKLKSRIDEMESATPYHKCVAP